MNKDRIALVSILFCISLPGAFAENLFQAEMQAYNAKDYAKAVSFGETFITSHPRHIISHYYLADCYVRLNRPAAAIEHYSICVALSPRSGMAKYSQQMIDKLVKELDSKVSSTAVQTSQNIPVNTGLNGEPQELSRRVITETQALQENALEESRKRINRLQQDSESMRRQIETRASQDIADIPEHITNQEGKTIHNPDYQSLKKAVEDEAARKQKALKESTARNIQAASDYANKKVADISNTIPNFQSQLKVGSLDSSRLTTAGTDLYVRNYINFNADPVSTLPAPKYLQPLQAPAMQKMILPKCKGHKLRSIPERINENNANN